MTTSRDTPSRLLICILLEILSKKSVTFTYQRWAHHLHPHFHLKQTTEDVPFHNTGVFYKPFTVYEYYHRDKVSFIYTQLGRT